MNSDVKVWHDARNKAVIYDKLPDPDRFLKLVPRAVRLHNGYIAAPTTLYNLQLTRHLGPPSFAPLEVNNYDFPGRYQPFSAQRVTANFLCLHPRAFCLSDMGTGKTLAALWAAEFIMRSDPGTRCLVVAPLSTLRRVWRDAIFENLLGRRGGVVLHGERAKRRALLDEPHDFYIINPEGLEIIASELAQRTDIRIAICDEASMFKDRTTRRHSVARKLIVPMDYVWLMTGTPTPNAPTDAYGLAKLVNGAQGESFASFRNRTMMQLSQFIGRPRGGAANEVHRLFH